MLLIFQSTIVAAMPHSVLAAVSSGSCPTIPPPQRCVHTLRRRETSEQICSRAILPTRTRTSRAARSAEIDDAGIAVLGPECEQPAVLAPGERRDRRSGRLARQNFRPVGAANDQDETIRVADRDDIFGRVAGYRLDLRLARRQRVRGPA